MAVLIGRGLDLSGLFGEQFPSSLPLSSFEGAEKIERISILDILSIFLFEKRQECRTNLIRREKWANNVAILLVQASLPIERERPRL